MNRPAIITTTIILVVQFLTSAEIIDFYTVNQNMWSSGNALTIEGGESFPLFDKSGNLGPIGPMVSTPKVTIPIPFFSDIVIPETNTGVQIDGSFDGSAALSFNYALTSGYVNAYCPYDINTNLPDQDVFSTNEIITLSSSGSIMNNSSIFTESPSVNFTIDFDYDIEAEVGYTLGMLTSTTSGSFFDINTTGTVNLLTLNNEGITTAFDNALGEIGSVLEINNETEQRKDNAEVDAELKKMDDNPGYKPDKETTDKITKNLKERKKSALSALGNAIDMEVSAPWIFTSSDEPDANGVLRSSGTDEFASASLDLDKVVGTMMGVPDLFGMETNLLGYELGYDIIDVKLTLDVLAEQEFTLVTTPKGQLDFSEDVFVIDNNGAEELTSSLTYDIGSDISFRLPSEATDLGITSSYFLEATLENETILDLRPGIEGRILGLTAGDYKPSLVSWDNSYDIDAELSIYNSTFALGGFNIVKNDYVWTVNESTNVPEGSCGLYLFLGQGALLLFSVTGRYRKNSRYQETQRL